MLRVWRSPTLRPTIDINLLGKTNTDEYNLVEQFRDILAVDVGEDGLVFNSNSIKTERITEDADYEGTRIIFSGKLGTARILMQIDIGFGDVVYPGVEEADLPTILDFPAARMLCYSRESLISEKYEVMVKRGELNSRMKDFYDLWVIAREFDFNGLILSEAIRNTFSRRRTLLPEHASSGLSPEFHEDTQKNTQWNAFIRKGMLVTSPPSLTDVCLFLETFLLPPTLALTQDQDFKAKWKPGGPWR